jgi:hypothetical protein
VVARERAGASVPAKKVRSLELTFNGRAALTNQDQKFWFPRQDVLDWLIGIIPADAKVLDIGPGNRREIINSANDSSKHSFIAVTTIAA